MKTNVKHVILFFWNAWWPLLTYDLIMSMVYLSGIMILGFLIGILGSPVSGTDLIEEAQQRYGLIMTTVGAVASAMPLWLVYDAKIQNVGNSKWNFRYFDMSLIAALGASLCIFGNLLVQCLPVSWESYEEISETMYTPSVTVQLASVGVAVPFAEELLFRGVIYGYMRRRVPAFAAIVLSALCFGIYHGNIVQAVYASFLGLFLAWLMEWYQTLAAPYLLHMSANMTSVLVSNTFIGVWMGNFFIIGILLLIISGSIAVYLLIKIHARRE